MSQNNRSILLLSIAFALIFFGFNGVQQYVTVYFDQLGQGSVGFVSLLLVYLFFMIFSPLAVPIMTKLGMVPTMILGGLVYGLYIYSLMVPSVVLVLVASCLLGVAAGMLWTAQGSYLLRSSDAGSYGRSAGLFTMIWALGAALGMMLFGFVSGRLGYHYSLILWGSIPFLGVGLLFFLPPRNVQDSRSTFMASLDGKMIRLGIVNFVFMFMFGLVIGSIPLVLKNSFSLVVIGIMGSLFFVTSVLCSYLGGRLSDIFGRRLLVMIGFLCAVLGLVCLVIPNKWIVLVGIILVSLMYAIMGPVLQAMAGDFGNTEQNVATFSAFRNFGVVVSLLAGLFIAVPMIFYVSLGVVVAGSVAVFSEVRKWG